MQKYDDIYFQHPQSLTVITGSESHGKRLQRLFKTSGDSQAGHANFVYQDVPSFPKKPPKQNFLAKSYNLDKSLTTNLRIGILPLEWPSKYSQIKPAVIIFVVNLVDFAPSAALLSIDDIYFQAEQYIKLQKIKVFFWLVAKQTRVEEEKTLIRGKYDQCTKIF